MARNELDALMADLEAMHREAFPLGYVECTVRYTTPVVVEELVLAHTGTRVEAWRVELEVCEAVAEETFLLPASVTVAPLEPAQDKPRATKRPVARPARSTKPKATKASKEVRPAPRKVREKTRGKMWAIVNKAA